MTLEDVETRIFGFFVHWLYTRSYRGTKKEVPNLIENANFYILSDRVMASELKKLLVQALRWMQPGISPKTGNTLKDFQHFAYSAQGDEVLRSEALYKSLDRLNAGNADTMIGEMPQGMLADFTKGMSQRWLSDQAIIGRQTQRLLELGDMDDIIFDDEMPDHERY